MRVYLPATLTGLADWRQAGEAAIPADGVAYAVTPTLREWYREADLEELEHAAQVAAAEAALGLLAASPSAPRRRVVLAADVEDAHARPAPQRGRAAVELAVAVPMSAWASALVDDGDSETAEVVAAAAAALDAARAGDDDAAFTVDEAQARELAWYAVQELADLT